MAVTVKHKIRFGPFVLDVHSSELYKHDCKLKVQPQPIQVLTILLEHPGELVTREALQNRIWPSDTFVDFEHGLNTAVKKLRQALGDESETPKYIETLPRRGYRFVAALPPSPDPLDSLVPSETEPPVDENLNHSDPRNLLIGFRTWLLLGAISLVIATLLVVTFRSLFPPTPKVVSWRRLTYTRVHKVCGRPVFCSLATDGLRVYFQERQSGRWYFSQVSTTGGNVAHLPVPELNWPCLRGISPSGSELLVADCCPVRFYEFVLPAGPFSLKMAPKQEGYWGIQERAGFLFTDNRDTDLYRATTAHPSGERLLTTIDITWPHLSPDGKTLSWTQLPTAGLGKHLWKADLKGLVPRPMFSNLGGETFYGDWTADGKLFFFLRGSGDDLSLWAVREKRLFNRRSQPVRLNTGPFEIAAPVASRNSKELFVIGTERAGELVIYDNKSSQFVPFLGGASICYVAFSPDRQWVAYVSYPGGTLWKSRVDGSQKIQITKPPLDVVNPQWSPDGKFIVFMGTTPTTFVSLYLVKAAEGEPRLLQTGSSESADPTWSPDGRSIAFASVGPRPREIQILNLDTMTSTAIPGSTNLASPRWSPNGKFIVAHKVDVNAKLMLYRFDDTKWMPLSSIEGAGWEAWSQNSAYVYSYDAPNHRVVRVKVSNGEVDPIVSLQGVDWTATVTSRFGWFGVTPDERIMVLRETGTQEIYALQLEY